MEGRDDYLPHWFPSWSLGTSGGEVTTWAGVTGEAEVVSVVGDRQRGMTLLELTVVLLILTTLATVALRSTSGLQDQARWEQTKNRYEAIRAAIIGDPKLTIHGQPDISGFVADMGRLPLNIKELLSQNYCDNNYKADEGGCGGTWEKNDAYFIGCSNGVSPDQVTCEAIPGETWHEILMGWNGPYLVSSEASTDEDAFVDGWGNLPADDGTDLNYGWNFVNVTPNLTLQSYGRDQIASGVGYDEDYPTDPIAMVEQEWKIDISGGMNINILSPSVGYCDITTLPNQSACEGAGQPWTMACYDTGITTSSACTPSPLIWNTTLGKCEDTSKTTSSACTPSPLIWLGNCSTFDSSTCNSMWNVWVTTGFCSDTQYSDQTNCESNAGVWFDSNSCLSKSKTFCDYQIGAFSAIKRQIRLNITYRDGNGSIETASSTNKITENGIQQIVTFSGFLDSSSNPVNLIPMGNNLIEVKDASNVVYPLGHSSVTIPFIPHKTVPTINW